MKGLLFLLLALPGLLIAQGKELRLDINGEIAIDPQGAVHGIEINTMLPPEIKETVGSSIRQWKFEPVLREGVPTSAKSKIWLRLIALPVAEKGYRLRIEKIRFLADRQSIDMTPPRYPKEAQRASISAAVLVAVRVDKRGNVLDAFATQTALFGVQARNQIAARWRKLFEDSAVDAAKRWKFMPVDVVSGAADETTLVMPVEYRIGDTQTSEAGWRGALAGPISPIPWLSVEKQQYDASGLKSGEFLALDNPPNLKTEVIGKTL